MSQEKNPGPRFTPSGRKTPLAEIRFDDVTFGYDDDQTVLTKPHPVCK